MNNISIVFLHSGKWEEVRALYLDQITGLENLHLQVKEGLQHLRSETDHLQRIEETIRIQREALDSTFQQFEHKQVLLQEKGKCYVFSSFETDPCSPYFISSRSLDRSNGYIGSTWRQEGPRTYQRILTTHHDYNILVSLSSCFM